ncbi:double-strand-break repair protein rad21-like protein 1 isoform X4 [Hyperolius riggenbachi]|uniref:double-strand-break repair protein rad21-like protein 1 isoform X4 n=1 Tax=Hyperolius riggenbachi TaxID=752182 RepID=UPI0035A31D80
MAQEGAENMFYTHCLLGNHGILSKIWIAAHWPKKLTKGNVVECNLETAVHNIVSPKMMSLRLSSHLLLGVVRVFQRKTKYLLDDCNEALLKLKINFRPDALDLPDDKLEAAYKAITLTEDFHDFDLPLPDINEIDEVDHFILHQSRPEDILMKEDYGGQMVLHDSFGGLDPMRQEFHGEGSLEPNTNSFLPDNSFVSMDADNGDLLTQDYFGDEFADADFFDNGQFLEYSFLGMDASKEVTLPASPLIEEQQPESEAQIQSVHSADDLDENNQEMPIEDPAVVNDTTVHSSQEDSFVLEPVDVTEIEKRKQARRKRKRKLALDDVTQIPSSIFRQQITDASSTVTSPVFAPNTRTMMEWKRTDGVQWLLANPSHPILNGDLLGLYKQSQTLDIAKKARNKRARNEPTEPDMDVFRYAEEEQVDLPQIEAAAPADVTSSHTEDQTQIQDLGGYDQMSPHKSNSAQKECDESLQSEIPGALSDESYEPTESMQAGGGDDRRCNRKTQEMLNSLRNMSNSGKDSFNLQEMCRNNRKKQVSAKFYSLLVLQNHGAIKLEQKSPFSDICATPGPQFHTL